jgi:hypothetical protein
MELEPPITMAKSPDTRVSEVLDNFISILGAFF